ncbi:MAG: hypothetical protein GX241_01490 [Ruminococcaceae bacterium]|nr:hypothetical protein [Oscillospiraceae bacterium]
MKKLIVCPKSSGNTHKVCDYVSKRSDFELEVVGSNNNTDLKECEVLILSSGVYGGHAHKNLLNFVKNLKSNNVNPDVKIYLFLTWFGMGSSNEAARKEINDLLAQNGLKLEEEYINCYGQGMVIIKRNHPDYNDKEKVLTWAREL